MGLVGWILLGGCWIRNWFNYRCVYSRLIWDFVLDGFVEGIGTDVGLGIDSWMDGYPMDGFGMNGWMDRWMEFGWGLDSELSSGCIVDGVGMDLEWNVDGFIV